MRNVKPGIQSITEHLITLHKTNGLMLSENKILRPMTRDEYDVYKSEVKGFGLKVKHLTENSKRTLKAKPKLEYQLYLEAVNKFSGKRINPSILTEIKRSSIISEYKITSRELLFEEDIMDKKIKNPETGREVKVATAYGDKDHPAHDQAAAMVGKHGGEDDDHHGDDHGHHDDGLSAAEKAALGIMDVALKNIPQLSFIAGQSEAIYKGMKDVYQSTKEVDGVINKSKAFGKGALGKLTGWAKNAKKEFVNSISADNAGQRRKLGEALATKTMAVAKGIVKGLVNEVKHVAHELGEGMEGIKDVLKDPKSLKDPATRKKLASGLKGACTVGVVALAVSSGGVGIAMKATSLAINPGDVMKALLTASVYNDLQRAGKLHVISESNEHSLNRIVEGKIDDLDETFILKIMSHAGGKELKEAKDPMNEYSEDDMDKCVKYTQMGNEIEEAAKAGKKEKSKEGDKKEKSKE